MPKTLSEKAQFEATNRMLVDDLNFLIAGIAIADIFVPLHQVAREAEQSGMHTKEEAQAIAGRVAGYLGEAVSKRREDAKRPESVIDLPRILLPN